MRVDRLLVGPVTGLEVFVAMNDAEYYEYYGKVDKIGHVTDCGGRSKGYSVKYPDGTTVTIEGG